MKNERVILLILAAVQFTHILDFMLVMPLGKQLMSIFDISPQQFSFIVTAYSFAAFAAGIVGAFVIDRYDRKVALLFAYVGFLVGTLFCALAPSFELMLVSRGIAGLFGGSLVTLVLSIVGDIIPYERRSTAMGVIMTAFSAASVVGVPFGLWLAAQYGWQMPFYAVVVIGLFVIAGIIAFMPSVRVHLERVATQTTPIISPLQNIINIFKDRNQSLALLFTVVLILGHFTIIPFIAPYMQLNVGFSDTEVAYIYLFGGLSTIVALPLFGYLGDKYGNFLIFAIISWLGLFSIWGVTNMPPLAMVYAILISTSYFIVASGRNVPATTMVTAVVRAESRGSFMSFRTSAQQLAMGVSAIIAGAIVTEGENGKLENYEWVGYLGIAMSLLAIVIGRYLKVVKDELPEEMTQGHKDTRNEN